MKNYLACSKKLLISFVAVSCLLFHISNANAFGLEDLSSSADSIKTASDTAQASADGASLLNRAKNVYNGFAGSTEQLINAQSTTMSLINPTQHVVGAGAFDSATGLTKLMEMTSLSNSLGSEMGGMDLTGRLTKIFTDPSSLEKAQSIYNNASGAYSSGKTSVMEAKTLYSEIKNFIASPSSKGLNIGLLENLGDYSDKILPFIMEHGPEQVQTAGKLAEVLKGFL